MSHPIPSVLQQPSPDASGTSPVDAIPAGLPVLESMHGSDAEFGFDELWPNATWQPPGAMPLPQSIDATEGYGHYTIGPPSQAMDIGNVLGANGNIAMYHVDNFCPS